MIFLLEYVNSSQLNRNGSDEQIIVAPCNERDNIHLQLLSNCVKQFDMICAHHLLHIEEYKNAGF